MPTHCIADAEKDADMKSLSPEEAIAILSDMKIDIPVPKAAVTQRKRNAALDMAISALSCSEIPNSSDSISRQSAIDALDKRFDSIPMEQTAEILQLRKDLRELPPAQPERKTVDLKIEKISKHQSDFSDLDAQPEIIRCHDCDHWNPGFIDDNDNFIPPKCGKYQQMVGHFADDYCSYAERREVSE